MDNESLKTNEAYEPEKLSCSRRTAHPPLLVRAAPAGGSAAVYLDITNYYLSIDT